MSMYKSYQYYKIINDVPSIHAIMSTIDNLYIIHLQVKLKLVVVVLSCESSNYFSFQSNWYTAIVLSMFMLHSFLWYMIYVIFLSGSEFVHFFFWVETNLCIFFYRICIYILPLEIQLSGGFGIPLTGLITSQARIWISNIIFSVQWVKSLFNLSFHNFYILCS